MWQSTISLRYVSYKNADSNLHERICAMAMMAKNLLWSCAPVVAPRPPINPQRPNPCCSIGAQPFLWRGRSWARSTLVVLCWLLVFSIAVFFSAGMLRDSVHIGDIIGTIGETIALASPPLWFAVMLRQRDIVRAFSPTRHAPDTSTQSLEPTAGRCDEQL
jgi:hypothetical protein